MGYKKFIHQRYFDAFLLLTICFAQSFAASKIRHIRARYDAHNDEIVVEWEWRGQQRLDEFDFFVRYKVGNIGEWNQVSGEDGFLEARLKPGRELSTGDDLTVQVVAEPKSRFSNPDAISEAELSEPMVIWISKREEDAEVSGIAGEIKDLLPPFNFTANVLDAATVRLEWVPSPQPVDISDDMASKLFYIINIRQTTANTGNRFPPQQIRVPDRQFLLGNLNPGEAYEITVRTAIGAEIVSSAAAIVEISLPKGDDFEVGNLVISSRFKADGHGVVNLTWEIPDRLAGKIKSYDVRYVKTWTGYSYPESATEWRQIIFPGENPKATLENLESDTEYRLRIKTILHSKLEVESGEFRFRTPRIGVSPTAKLDVIYSSEDPSIRLQWVLAPHISPSLISSFEVYISDRLDAKLDQWRLIRVPSGENQAVVENLRPGTTYYVKVNVRNIDGTIVEGQQVYRFTIMESEMLPISRSRHLEFRRSRSPALAQIGQGVLHISWEFSEDIEQGQSGTSILYNTNSNEPLERWSRVVVHGGEKRAITLAGLREDTLYSVYLIPIDRYGHQRKEFSQRKELRTEFISSPKF